MPRNVDGPRTRPGPPGTMGTRPDGAAMQFTLIDNVLEQSQDRIRAVKQVSAAEEYLADHFPGFPILPGVMMIEVLVQAARAVACLPPMPGRGATVTGMARIRINRLWHSSCPISATRWRQPEDTCKCSSSTGAV